MPRAAPPAPGLLRLYPPRYIFGMAHEHSISSFQLDIEVKGRDIVVSVTSARFSAVYYKAAGQPQLILRQRSKCDDYELLAEVWHAANAKARELGWIV
jgi:hypothetical protein